MEKNNGKIAIAIVAMFVVALSIVGVTYAYFVASVTGNSTKNIDVTAGIIEVTFTEGEGEVDALNVVPGWISDGHHYFDSEEYTLKEGKMAYTAQYTADATAQNLTKNDGITPADTFSVVAGAKNSDAANYVIILNGIAKLNVNAEDATNFKYALCETECPTYTGTTDAEGNYVPIDATSFATLMNNDAVITSGTIAPNGEKVQVISGIESIAAASGSKTYQLAVYYLNDATKAQESKSATLTAEIDLIGVQQSGSDWVDADGTIITPAA